MKSLILLTLCAAVLGAQSVSDPVVVTIEGKDWTQSAFDAMIRSLPSQLRKGYEADKRGWLGQYTLMTHLAEIAKQEGIDQKAPYKQQIAYNNLAFLAECLLGAHEKGVSISKEDMKAWFESHKSEYKRARVRGILVSWGQASKPGEKMRTDAEAAAIIDDIVKRANAGESFADLAKQYSEDVKTKDNGGEFPLIKPEDHGINSSIKAAIFTIKPHEVSRAVRLPGGIYVFQLEEFVDPKLEELNDEIITQMGHERSIQWIEGVRKESKFEIKDPAFFGLPAKK